MKQIAVIILLFMVGSFTNQVYAQKKDRAVVCFQSDMDCADCENTLYEYLKFEKGVKDLKIDHASNTILIEYVEKKNNDNAFAKAIEKKGYKAKKIDREQYNKIVADTKKQSHEHQTEIHKERN